MVQQPGSPSSSIAVAARRRHHRRRGTLPPPFVVGNDRRRRALPLHRRHACLPPPSPLRPLKWCGLIRNTHGRRRRRRRPIVVVASPSCAPGNFAPPNDVRRRLYCRRGPTSSRWDRRGYRGAKFARALGTMGGATAPRRGNASRDGAKLRTGRPPIKSREMAMRRRCARRRSSGMYVAGETLGGGRCREVATPTDGEERDIAKSI